MSINYKEKKINTTLIMVMLFFGINQYINNKGSEVSKCH